ncbi:hypothetical protein FEK34_01600 [Nocardia cyriacigeorgica]|uniref:Plasmid maintenance system killer protein n=1 Tax=Nocardia cyriacigeorgica TaxID=135487 RepID=A0A5R8P0R6_9NOCA|nr:hypothetical protein FEK34_01600 [Nocardia cyriacigeorgica]
MRQVIRRIDRHARSLLAGRAPAEQLADPSVQQPVDHGVQALGAGDREGQYSIRINQQWRICFRWTEAGAHDVEIVDYH